MPYSPLSSLPNLFTQNGQNKSVGVLAPKPYVASQNMSIAPKNIGVKTQSVNNNLVVPPNTTPQPVKAQPDPNVMAEQKALISKGATNIDGTPLQADGIVGKNTLAARAKYAAPVNPIPTPNNPTPPAPTYSAQDTGLYGNMIADLANRSTETGDAYNKSMDAYNKTAQDILDFNKQKAQQTSDINQSGTWTSRALGEQGQANIQNAATEAALSGKLQAQSNVITGANTQQGLLQSALQNAIGYAQPQLGAVGTQTYYNPITGQTSNGGTNTPFSGGIAQGNVALGQQYAQNISANNQAKTVKNQIVNDLNATPLNPSDFTDINSFIQLLSGKVSNPKYQILSNQLAEYVNTLTPILGVGGDNTNLKTQIAQGMINGQASGQSIVDVLNGIERLADAKLQSQAGGTNGSAINDTSTQNNTVSAGGYAFKKVNGKWVPA